VIFRIGLSGNSGGNDDTNTQDEQTGKNRQRQVMLLRQLPVQIARRDPVYHFRRKNRQGNPEERVNNGRVNTGLGDYKQHSMCVFGAG
jgi:hypothetical protein